MKKILFISLLLLFFCQPIMAQEIGGSDLVAGIPENTAYEKAEVLETEDFSRYDELMQQTITGQKVKVKILGGEYENKTKEIENIFQDLPSDVSVESGEKIIVYIQDYGEDNYNISIFDKYRLNTLIWFVGLFLVLLVIIGGKQGLKAIISLSLSIVLIWKVLIPGILKGWDPLWLTLGLSIIIILVTLLLIAGFKKKSWAAILGTIAGVGVAAILAIIFGNLAQLAGTASNEAHSLFHISGDLNFQNILFASIILGALGAIMDVGISVASAVAEVKSAKSTATFKELFKSGLNVGKDVMGTMSNTLIFAYVGSSLFLILLFSTFEQPALKLLNFNFIADEVVRAMAGSIGLIMAIPLTALIAAYLEARKTEKKD